MKTTWNIEKKRYPAFKGEKKVDVVVIGGGLAGVVTAYLLSKKGKKVALLEARELGAGMTMYTTAIVTSQIDTSMGDLIKMLGLKNAKVAWKAGEEAISTLEKIITEEKIDCDFVRVPSYSYANDEKEYEEVLEEHLTLKKAGFNVELGEDGLVIPHAGYYVLANQAKFHPLKFLLQLVEKTKALGCEIFEKSEVKEITGKLLVSVHTKKGVIQTREVIVATYMPFNNPKSTHYKKGMYTSYMMEFEILHKALQEAVYEDMANPYHYFRVDREKTHDRILIGGEDHRAELHNLAIVKKKSFQALAQYAEKILKDVPHRLVRKWSGGILEPSDGLPLIGRTHANRYVATAFSGNGMTYSIIAGILLRDLILKRKNSWQELYDPKRKLKLKSLVVKGKDYTEELIQGIGKNLLK